MGVMCGDNRIGLAAAKLLREHGVRDAISGRDKTWPEKSSRNHRLRSRWFLGV